MKLAKPVSKASFKSIDTDPTNVDGIKGIFRFNNQKWF